MRVTYRSLAVAGIALLAACKTSTERFRDNISDQAIWLGEGFKAKLATTSGSQTLKQAYSAAVKECAQITSMVDNNALRPPIADLREIECKLEEIRSKVAAAEALEAESISLRSKLASEKAKLAAATPTTITALTANVNQLTAVSDAIDALKKASTRKDLTAAVAQAKSALKQTTAQPSSSALAKQHGKLQAAIDAEITRVRSLIDNERKKDENTTRLSTLIEAEGLLRKGRDFVKGSKLPSKFELDEAKKAMDAGKKKVAAAAADITLYTTPWFLAHTGIISQSPYTLVDGRPTSRFQLSEGSADTRYYLELDAFHRRAWLNPEQQIERNPDYDFGHSFPDWLVPDDYEARLRFVNQDEAISSQVNAIGGEYAVEGAVGWNLFGFGLKDAEQCKENPELKKLAQGTVNFEISGGFTTDSTAIDAHPYVQTGIASVWSFPMQIAPKTYRTARVYTGIHYSLFDFPQLDVDDRQYIVGERPVFNTLGALGARVDMTIPISTSFDAVVGARYWTPLRRDALPDTWSVFIGVSVPIGKIVKATLGS